MEDAGLAGLGDSGFLGRAGEADKEGGDGGMRREGRKECEEGEAQSDRSSPIDLKTQI